MSKKHIHQEQDTNNYYLEYRWMTIEVITKLMMNGLLSTIAILPLTEDAFESEEQPSVPVPLP